MKILFDLFVGRKTSMKAQKTLITNPANMVGLQGGNKSTLEGPNGPLGEIYFMPQPDANYSGCKQNYSPEISIFLQLLFFPRKVKIFSNVCRKPLLLKWFNGVNDLKGARRLTHIGITA